jgi:hypothetical protein
MPITAMQALPLGNIPRKAAMFLQACELSMTRPLQSK